MRFAVTGGAGFIGHNIVRQLEALGHECLILDTQTDYGTVPAGEMAFLRDARGKRIASKIYNIDICDQLRVAHWFENVAGNIDAVIHLASFPRQKTVEHTPIRAASVMGTGLVSVLEMAKTYNVQKFVYVSSSMVYGDYPDLADERYPCNPKGYYGILKLMGEQLVKDWSRTNSRDHVIVRPSAVYGEHDVSDRVVSKFILKSLKGHLIEVKGRDEILDFTHVDDAALGIVLAATCPDAKNRTFNITRCQDQPQTLLNAAILVSALVGRTNMVIDQKDASFPSRGRLSNFNAQTILGYHPSIDISEGFARYHEWLKTTYLPNVSDTI